MENIYMVVDGFVINFMPKLRRQAKGDEIMSIPRSCPKRLGIYKTCQECSRYMDDCDGDIDVIYAEDDKHTSWRPED